jgi:tight adherence protein C
MASALIDNALFAGVFVLVAGAVAGLLFGLRTAAATQEGRTQRRMRATAGRAAQLDATAAVMPAEAQGRSLIDAALRPLANVATPTDDEERQGVRARLGHAGYRSERALYVYMVVKLTLGLCFAALVVFYNARQPQPIEQAALYTIVAMILGFYAPNVWLAGRVAERQAQLNRALPDALDLLVTCVEAGLGLDGALNRIADEVRLASPLLASELSQAGLEMRAGLTRGDAVRRLANRTGLDELKYLASVIVQTEMFGTSIAKSLRVMSDGMRVRRTQKAEERAATVAVKMTLPLVLCILPSLFTILLGPAVINIVRIMLPTLGGQGVDP